VADNRQFGSPKASHFGDKPIAGDTGHCGQCDAMLADALDGTLSVEEQALFDLHTAHCGPCAQLLADAQRGAAWLEMLRDPRPEPPAALLERILAQTSGAVTGGVSVTAHPLELPYAPVPALIHGDANVPGYGVGLYATQGNVLPFRVRATAAVRGSSFGQLMLQPRLAMTAAMAFLSIALTLDLTGVRLQDLRASDLKPSSLKRDFYSANAHVVQYYEGLRVVYELESRVHDLQSATDNDAASSSPFAPASNPGQPSSQPAPANSGPDARPKQQKPAPNSGTSRRNDIRRTQLVAEVRGKRQTEGSTV
jgi:Putative zinc-finger